MALLWWTRVALAVVLSAMTTLSVGGQSCDPSSFEEDTDYHNGQGIGSATGMLLPCSSCR
eukprot:m.74894 g.74894  ORF g.74894 m.74894 type:complete len:60 (+) comp8946_c0_seq2:342-521(+)